MTDEVWCGSWLKQGMAEPLLALPAGASYAIVG